MEEKTNNQKDRVQETMSQGNNLSPLAGYYAPDDVSDNSKKKAEFDKEAKENQSPQARKGNHTRTKSHVPQITHKLDDIKEDLEHDNQSSVGVPNQDPELKSSESLNNPQEANDLVQAGLVVNLASEQSATIRRLQRMVRILLSSFKSITSQIDSSNSEISSLKEFVSNNNKEFLDIIDSKEGEFDIVMFEGRTKFFADSIAEVCKKLKELFKTARKMHKEISDSFDANKKAIIEKAKNDYNVQAHPFIKKNRELQAKLERSSLLCKQIFKDHCTNIEDMPQFSEFNKYEIGLIEKCVESLNYKSQSYESELRAILEKLNLKTHNNNKEIESDSEALDYKKIISLIHERIGNLYSMFDQEIGGTDRKRMDNFLNSPHTFHNERKDSEGQDNSELPVFEIEELQLSPTLEENISEIIEGEMNVSIKEKIVNRNLSGRRKEVAESVPKQQIAIKLFEELCNLDLLSFSTGHHLVFEIYNVLHRTRNEISNYCQHSTASMNEKLVELKTQLREHSKKLEDIQVNAINLKRDIEVGQSEMTRLVKELEDAEGIKQTEMAQILIQSKQEFLDASMQEIDKITLEIPLENKHIEDLRREIEEHKKNLEIFCLTKQSIAEGFNLTCDSFSKLALFMCGDQLENASEFIIEQMTPKFISTYLYKQDNQRLAEENSSLQKRIQTLEDVKKICDDIEKKIIEQSATLEIQTKTITDLKLAVQEKDNRINDLENEPKSQILIIETLQSDKDRLTSELSISKERITELEKSISVLSTTIEELRETLAKSVDAQNEQTRNFIEIHEKEQRRLNELYLKKTKEL